MHLGFDRELIDAGHIVMFVNPERPGEGRQQMILVHLRVALNRILVLHVFRNLAQFLNVFLFQLLERVSHDVPCYCGFVATYLIVPSISPRSDKSASPDGKLFLLRRYAMMLAHSSRPRLCGASCGIDDRVRSKSCATVRPSQSPAKPLSASDGASAPEASAPWHFWHFSL